MKLLNTLFFASLVLLVLFIGQASAEACTGGQVYCGSYPAGSCCSGSCIESKCYAAGSTSCGDTSPRKVCNPDQVCISGNCQAKGSTSCGSSYCGADQTCISGSCYAKGSTSCGSSVCDANHVCLNGQCAPSGSSACGSSYCTSDKTCISGSCYAAGSSACGSFVCNSQQVCLNQQCAPKGSTACGSSYCTSDKTCISGSCYAAGSFACGNFVCSKDQSCVNGGCRSDVTACGFRPCITASETCIDGVCFPKGSTKCAKIGASTGGKTCRTNTDCLGTYCAKASAAGASPLALAPSPTLSRYLSFADDSGGNLEGWFCNALAPCPAGFECSSVIWGYCYSPSTVGTEGHVCVPDGTCNTVDLTCTNNKCVRSCAQAGATCSKASDAPVSLTCCAPPDRMHRLDCELSVSNQKYVCNLKSCAPDYGEYVAGTGGEKQQCYGDGDCCNTNSKCEITDKGQMCIPRDHPSSTPTSTPAPKCGGSSEACGEPRLEGGSWICSGLSCKNALVCNEDTVCAEKCGSNAATCDSSLNNRCCRGYACENGRCTSVYPSATPTVTFTPTPTAAFCYKTGEAGCGSDSTQCCDYGAGAVCSNNACSPPPLPSSSPYPTASVKPTASPTPTPPLKPVGAVCTDYRECETNICDAGYCKSCSQLPTNYCPTGTTCGSSGKCEGEIVCPQGYYPLKGECKKVEEASIGQPCDELAYPYILGPPITAAPNTPIALGDFNIATYLSGAKPSFLAFEGDSVRICANGCNCSKGVCVEASASTGGGQAASCNPSVGLCVCPVGSSAPGGGDQAGFTVCDPAHQCNDQTGKCDLKPPVVTSTPSPSATAMPTPTATPIATISPPSKECGAIGGICSLPYGLGHARYGCPQGLTEKQGGTGSNYNCGSGLCCVMAKYGTCEGAGGTCFDQTHFPSFKGACPSDMTKVSGTCDSQYDQKTAICCKSNALETCAKYGVDRMCLGVRALGQCSGNFPLPVNAYCPAQSNDIPSQCCAAPTPAPTAKPTATPFPTPTPTPKPSCDSIGGECAYATQPTLCPTCKPDTSDVVRTIPAACPTGKPTAYSGATCPAKTGAVGGVCCVSQIPTPIPLTGERALVATAGKVTETDQNGNTGWVYTPGVRVYFASRLDNGNTLMGIDSSGGCKLVEIDASGKTVWSYNYPVKGACGSAVRLANGNTLFTAAIGNPLSSADAAVAEVKPDGNLAWGYSHATSKAQGKDAYPIFASGMKNGHALVVDAQNHYKTYSDVYGWWFSVYEMDAGKVVKEYKINYTAWSGYIYSAFELPSGNILVNTGRYVLELDASSNVVWNYKPANDRVVMAMPKDNGNILLCGVAKTASEITKDKTEVWAVSFKGQGQCNSVWPLAAAQASPTPVPETECDKKGKPDGAKCYPAKCPAFMKPAEYSCDENRKSDVCCVPDCDVFGKCGEAVPEQCSAPGTKVHEITCETGKKLTCQQERQSDCRLGILGPFAGPMPSCPADYPDSKIEGCYLVGIRIGDKAICRKNEFKTTECSASPSCPDGFVSTGVSACGLETDAKKYCCKATAVSSPTPKVDELKNLAKDIGAFKFKSRQSATINILGLDGFKQSTLLTYDNNGDEYSASVIEFDSEANAQAGLNNYIEKVQFKSTDGTIGKYTVKGGTVTYPTELYGFMWLSGGRIILVQTREPISVEEKSHKFVSGVNAIIEAYLKAMPPGSV